MSNKNRSFLVVSIFSAIVSVSGLSAAEAAQTNWSDPASWPNRKVPIAGDKVTIGRDKDVVLDVSPPALGGLSIDGKLTFSNNADLELTTEWVMIHGELAIGTERDPDNVAPLVGFLASEAAGHVNGQVFGSFGYNVALMSQPKVIRTIKNEHRWTVDELAEIVPQAFGPEFVGQANMPGITTNINALPDEQWVTIAEGLRAWTTTLEPYGELVW